MKILITGGTGVIGAGVIPALLEKGHELRLLSRGADRDAREWPHGVEPFAADIGHPTELLGAADGCDAVIHITGIVDEKPPEVTFESVNVAGTRNMLTEADRAGVKRFVYISSLGADRGKSDYHRSKLKAEEEVKLYSREWVILRPGNVYGPGDDVISALLKMVRSFPAIPTVDGGDQSFQPVWFEDLGQAIAGAVERPDAAHQTLALAGEELTSTTDIIERLGRITDRDPVQVSIPAPLAAMGTQLAGMFGALTESLTSMMGVALPISQSKLTMLLEENVIREPEVNALTSALGIRPTPLDTGLKVLADELPELLPTDGVGSMERKRFWADIEGPKLTHTGMMTLFKEHVNDIMPMEFAAEPGAPTRIEKGFTLTANIPMRGNIQVRVEECTDDRVTFATVEGHPLAGIVTFRTEQLPGVVRFIVEIHARASNIFDWIAMRTVGRTMQNTNWEQVVERMVEKSGGEAPDGVESDTETLDDSEAEAVEKWIESLITERKRQEHGAI